MATRPKYEPLRRYLEAASAGGRQAVDLDFADIADMVGGLPETAYGRRQWWSNDSKVQAQAWRAAGWHVETVSLDRRRVRFTPGKVGGSYATRKALERDRRSAAAE